MSRKRSKVEQRRKLDEAKALYFKGVGIREIARRTGLSTATIWYHMQIEGWERELQEMEEDVREEILARIKAERLRRLHMLYELVPSLIEVVIEKIEADAEKERLRDLLMGILKGSEAIIAEERELGLGEGNEKDRGGEIEIEWEA